MPYDANSVTHGYLLLFPLHLPLKDLNNKAKKWQRRWFQLLRDGVLRYYLEHTEAFPIETFSLTECISITKSEAVTSFPFSICLSFQDQQIYIRAQKKFEYDNWLRHLRALKDELSKKPPGNLQRSQTTGDYPKRNSLQRSDDSSNLDISVLKHRRQQSANDRGNSNTLPRSAQYLSPRSRKKSRSRSRDNRRVSAPSYPSPPPYVDSQGSWSRSGSSGNISSSQPNFSSVGLSLPNLSKSRDSSNNSLVDIGSSNAPFTFNRRKQKYTRSQENLTYAETTRLRSKSVEDLLESQVVANRIRAINEPQVPVPPPRSSFGDATQSPAGTSLSTSRKGWLLLWHSVAQNWTKHWFALCGQTLIYYKNVEAEEQNIADGSIDLSTCRLVKEHKLDRNFGFRLTTGEGTVQLAALTQGIRSKWVDSLTAFMRSRDDAISVSSGESPHKLFTNQVEVQRRRSHDDIKPSRPVNLTIHDSLSEDQPDQIRPPHTSTSEWSHSRVPLAKMDTFNVSQQLPSFEDSSTLSVPTPTELPRSATTPTIKRKSSLSTEALHQELRRVHEECKQLRAQLNSERMKFSSKDESFQEREMNLLKQRCNDLEVQSNDWKEKALRAEKQYSQISDLSQCRQEYIEEMHSLQEKYDANKEELNKSEKKLKAREAELTESEKQIKHLTTSKILLQEEIKNRFANISQSTDDTDNDVVADLKSKLEAERRAFEAEMRLKESQFNDVISGLRNEIAELTQAAVTRTQQARVIAELKHQLTVANESLAVKEVNLQQSTSETSKLREQIDELREKLKSSQDGSETIVHESKLEVDALKKDLTLTQNEMSKLIISVDQLSQENSSLKNTLDREAYSVHQLQVQLGKEEAARKEVLDNLEKERSAKSELVSKLETEVYNRNAIERKHESELKACGMRHESALKDLRRLKSLTDARLQESEKNVLNLREQLETSLEHNTSELQQEVGVLQREISGKNSELSSCHSTISNLKQEIDDIQQQFRSTESQLLRQVNDLQSQVMKKQSDLSNLEQQINCLNGLIAKTQLEQRERIRNTTNASIQCHLQLSEQEEEAEFFKNIQCIDVPGFDESSKLQQLETYKASLLELRSQRNKKKDLQSKLQNFYALSVESQTIGNQFIDCLYKMSATEQKCAFLKARLDGSRKVFSRDTSWPSVEINSHLQSIDKDIKLLEAVLQEQDQSYLKYLEWRTQPSYNESGRNNTLRPLSQRWQTLLDKVAQLSSSATPKAQPDLVVSSGKDIDRVVASCQSDIMQLARELDDERRGWCHCITEVTNSLRKLGDQTSGPLTQGLMKLAGRLSELGVPEEASSEHSICSPTDCSIGDNLGDLASELVKQFAQPQLADELVPLIKSVGGVGSVDATWKIIACLNVLSQSNLLITSVNHREVEVLIDKLHIEMNRRCSLHSKLLNRLHQLQSHYTTKLILNDDRIKGCNHAISVAAFVQNYNDSTNFDMQSLISVLRSAKVSSSLEAREVMVMLEMALLASSHLGDVNCSSYQKWIQVEIDNSLLRIQNYLVSSLLHRVAECASHSLPSSSDWRKCMEDVHKWRKQNPVKFPNNLIDDEVQKGLLNNTIGVHKPLESGQLKDSKNLLQYIIFQAHLATSAHSPSSTENVCNLYLSPLLSVDSASFSNLLLACAVTANHFQTLLSLLCRSWPQELRQLQRDMVATQDPHSDSSKCNRARSEKLISLLSNDVISRQLNQIEMKYVEQFKLERDKYSRAVMDLQAMLYSTSPDGVNCLNQLNSLKSERIALQKELKSVKEQLTDIQNHNDRFSARDGSDDAAALRQTVFDYSHRLANLTKQLESCQKEKSENASRYEQEIQSARKELQSIAAAMDRLESQEVHFDNSQNSAAEAIKHRTIRLDVELKRDMQLSSESMSRYSEYIAKLFLPDSCDDTNDVIPFVNDQKNLIKRVDALQARWGALHNGLDKALLSKRSACHDELQKSAFDTGLLLIFAQHNGLDVNKASFIQKYSVQVDAIKHIFEEAVQSTLERYRFIVSKFSTTCKTEISRLRELFANIVESNLSVKELEKKRLCTSQQLVALFDSMKMSPRSTINVQDLKECFDHISKIMDEEILSISNQYTHKCLQLDAMYQQSSLPSVQM